MWGFLFCFLLLLLLGKTLNLFILTIFICLFFTLPFDVNNYQIIIIIQHKENAINCFTKPNLEIPHIFSILLLVPPKYYHFLCEPWYEKGGTALDQPSMRTGTVSLVSASSRPKQQPAQKEFSTSLSLLYTHTFICGVNYYKLQQ